MKELIKKNISAILGGTPLEFDHLGIVVYDCEVSREKLEKSGFNCSSALSEELIDQNVRVLFVGGGDNALELLAPLKSEGKIFEFLKKRGEGIHHIAFRCKNLEDVLVSLKLNGIRLVDETPRKGARGHKVAFIHPSAMLGILIELIEI